MFRMWAKVFKDNRLVKDIVIEDDDPSLNRTKKVFKAIDEVCYEFDLGKPIWLDANIKDFKRHDRVKFRQDNFIEPIEFEFLEIHIIEEDM